VSTHGIGAVVTLTTEVRDYNDDLVDPAGITLTVMLPDGTTVGPFSAPEVVPDSLGAYHYDFATAGRPAGRYIARWVSTNPTGVDEESFDVAAMWAEAGVISLAEAKQQLNITTSDHDDELSMYVQAVTAVCERYVGALGRRTYVETHVGGYGLVLNRAPVLSIASATSTLTSGLDQAVGDLDIDVSTGVVRRLDGGYMCGPLRVTYAAGRAEIPPHVRLAALMLLQHLWETQRGQMGGVRVGGSDEVYDPRWGFAIPRRVLELLGDQISGIA
jgi:hypothetical protein